MEFNIFADFLNTVSWYWAMKKKNLLAQKTDLK